MEVIKEELDSEAFGRVVLKLNDVESSHSFEIFEKNYIEKYNPEYVYTKIEVDKISDIHYLEENGFEFIECQLQLFRRLTHFFDLPASGEMKLKVEEVISQDDLNAIYEISDISFNVDRIFVDAKIDKDIARKRYHLYIRNSFFSRSQRLDKLVDIKSNKIIGFHTLRYKDEGSVQILLGAILPEYQKSGAPFISDSHIYNDLLSNRRKNIITHVSASNVKVLNYLQKILGFRIKRNFVVLRKIY